METITQKMKHPFLITALLGLSVLSLAGCGGRQQSTAPMAPPVASGSPMNGGGVNGNMGGNMGGGMNGNMAGRNIPVDMQTQGGGGVYNWQDVPANQQVAIVRGQFDQGGYQLVTDSGDTIVVPFTNQNLYVMRFGRSNGQTYFTNENGAPTLYLAQGFGLANAAAQGANWYPLPTNFNYQQPVYVGVAPSWNDYLGMGWYPGMAVYGGMYGYNPYHPIWMPGFYINIGGSPYYGWGGYHSYYTSHPGYYHTTYGSNRGYYNTMTRGTGSYRYTGTYRSAGSTGSYRPGSTGTYRPGGGTGSFGTGTRSSGGFGSGSRPSGSFNNGGGFNGGRTGGFGGGATGPSTRGSFGGGGTTMPSTRGSFGGGGGGFNSTPRPSGGSSFGGGGSFGGGRSSGGSFGGGRRR